MQCLDIYSEPGRSSADLIELLSGYFVVQQLEIGMLRSRRPGKNTILDISVRDGVRLAVLKSWLEARPQRARSLILLDSKDSPQMTAALNTGVDRVMMRPIDPRELLAYLVETPRAGEQANARRAVLEATVSRGVGTLSTMFSSARSGQPVDANLISTAGEQIVEEIGHAGLSDWVELVRKHHDRTYQHCLLVTGVGVAFARHLGLPAKDQARISFAGLIHDIGKAKIPLAILEKPGALDENQWRIVRAHPEYGVEALAGRSDIPSFVLDVVRHHHEYLDGSGYPDGLRGNPNKPPRQNDDDCGYIWRIA